MLPKISILTPCYNGALFFNRWIHSIISQDYSNLEIIFVDDGSTDNIKGIIDDYMPLLSDLGITFIYIYQKNQGQAAAVNNGLKHCTGVYLSLLDIDDAFLNNSLILRAQYLNKHQNCNIVFSNGFHIYESEGYKKKIYNDIKQCQDCSFESVITGRLHIAAGTYLLRLSALSAFYQGNDIYITPAGQNAQLTLPLVHNRSVSFIDLPLVNIYHQVNSHSDISSGYKNGLCRIEQWEDVYMHMAELLSTSLEEKSEYENLIKRHWFYEKLAHAFTHKRYNDARHIYKQYTNHKHVTILEKCYYWQNQWKIAGIFLRAIRWLLSLPKRVIKSMLQISSAQPHMPTSDKEQCSGCHACASICPTNCIHMKPDHEGFLYPQINKEKCNACELCTSICPFKQKALDNNKVPQAFAAYCTDEKTRYISSSGGVFGCIAKKVIKDGGIVFGARFNEENEVIHDCTKTLEGLPPLFGSKYIQSRIDDNMIKAKQLLKQGKQVLFCGTPCQIEGLHAFLGKRYENLFLVDFICHGVPSPLVWKEQLKQFTHPIKHISFRDKTNGWKKSGQVIATIQVETPQGNVTFREPLFGRGFLQNYFLRPSCYNCQTKKIIRASDLTLADYWGIEQLDPSLNDDKGLSLVMVNSKRGERLLQDSNLWRKPVDLFDSIQYNSSMHTSVALSSKRNNFFHDLKKLGYRKVMKKYCNPNRGSVLMFSILQRGRNLLRKIVRRKSS